MGGKKSIIAMFLVVILAGGAGLGYSWHRESVNARTFSGSGYVLNPNTETETKRTLFGEGTVWKKGLSDTVVFDDVQGSRTEVDGKSFVHYDNNDLSALSDGVLVNLDDLDNGEITNHYALSSRVTCQWDGSGYQLGSGESAVSFTDCIWKLDADKYLLRSDNIQMSFAADDMRDAGEFVEVTYIDNGVIQLQTADNLWQTISENCEAILASGERVNLSRKNVTDAAGNVLIDFAKIVVGSDDNIEITPDTKSLKDELDASKEEAGVIPHFDITAENGKAGAAGTSGTNGQSGTDGTIGDDGTDGSEGDPGDAGTAGGNGSAGASGSNGKNGSSGSSGSSGAAGTGATVDGTVLDYPKFNITDWAVTTTGCSGKITIKNTEMINRASEHANDGVYLIDVETGTRIDSIMGMDFKSETADGIEFKFENKLKPDHSYRLVVTACINTGLQNAQDYMRDFISKTFWTDSAGVMMEAGPSTTTSVSLTVRQQGYTSRATSATVYLYSEKSRAQAATVENPGADATYTANFPASSTSAPASFDGLTPNTYYYVRVAASGVMPSQVLTLRTLKRNPSMTNPQLSPNRDSWGFDITPGSIQDPDGAITSVTYYFYAENDTNSENAVHSVTVKKPSQSFTVPIEGTGLVKGSRYYVRAKLNFNDNEKDRTFWTGKSNVAQINGGKLPSVYFVNNGSGTTGDSGGSSTSSGYYDQIYGTLHVSPGSEGSRLLADENHHPTVTIRASGYYYVQYTVYNKNDSNKPQSGNYLTAGITSDGCVEIEIPNKVLSEDGQVGTVSGLRPATQYQMIVTGDLSTDGTNVSEASARVGSCVVDTKKMSDANANWNDSDTLEGTSKFTTTLKLADATSTTEQADSSFSRQMDTLSTITLSLRAGTVANPGTELGRVTLTRDNYTSYLSAAQQEASGSTEDSANKVRSLGELMTKGLVMNENTFNTSNDPNFSQKLTYISSVCITVSEAKDYTANAANRVNQKAYASIDSNDISAPGASSSDGAVYINETRIVKDATHEITLGESPDAPPESGNGFDKSLLSQTTDPEKGYALSPNYLNSAKLAKTITFYAFDNPDYTADYDSTDYTVDTSLYPDSTPKMAATALKNGQGAWLGRLTVEVPQNGVMPKARFLPMTIETYVDKVYTDDAQKQQAKTAYANGTLTDDNGYYLFFLDSNHETETARGHQYTFAWTMTYELTSGDTTKTHSYPFDLDRGARSWYDFVPHSLPQDAPYDEPTFYALPYSTEQDTVTWAVSIVDPDGVATTNDQGEVPLYNRQSNSSGSDLSLAAAVDSQINAGFVTDGKHLVAVPKNVFNTYGNAAIAARVQWYTNKYTNGGKGLFDGTNAMGYTVDTVRYSSKTQSNSIPYYKNVFVLKNEALDNPNPNNISVVVEPQSPSGSSAVNTFRVTVTGPQTELDKANAVRLTFSGGGQKISIDKFIAGADGQSAGDGSISFLVPIARELADLASTKNVSVAAELVYETNAEGFSYIEDNDYSLRTYSMVSNSSLGSELKEFGWYWFSNTGKLANNATELLPRFGSFFSKQDVNLKFAVNDKTGQLTGSMSVASTRDSSLLPRRESMEFTMENGGASVNGLFVVPRVLNEVTIKNCQYSDGNTSYDFPAIVPVISYSSASGTANSVSTNYVVQPANSTIRFLLLKGTKAENSTNYSYNTVMYRENGRWNEAAFDETKVAAGDWLTDGDNGTISFNNLPADQHYRIVAYYKDSDGTWKLCNMYNDSGTEIVNSRDVNTISKPNVTLRMSYVKGSYTDKRIAVDVSVKDAANYYYTLELQDSNGRITYLPCGDDDSSTVKKTHLYSVGTYQIQNPNPDFADKYEYHGLLYKADGFDTENHKLNATDERIYLNYGTDYTVRLRIYNKGFGPAYGGNESDDLMMSGLSSGEVEPSAVKTFTVPSAVDTATLGGSFDLRSSNGSMVPTITFQPNYVVNSLRIRLNRVAVAVIRKDADGNLTDVTQYAKYTGDENLDLASEFINFGSKQYITLQEGNGLTFEAGDTFTCYLYGVMDYESATTEGFTTEVQSRDAILAGRALDGDKLMNTERIAVDHGESLLLASREVRYTSSETSAGTVSVQYRNGKFYLHLANPVNITAIHALDWSVTAEYTDASDQADSTSRIGIKTALVLDSVADNEYEMELPADFGSSLDDVTVTNYRITIQFFTALDDGTYSSSGITMTTNSSSGVVDSTTDGMKLTVNITPNRGNALTDLIDALFPTEEQPVQDGEQPTGDEPAEQPDDTAEPENPAEDEQPAEDGESGTDADTPEDGQTETTPPDSGTTGEDTPAEPDTPAAEPSPQPSVSEPETGGAADNGAADSSEQTDSGAAESGGSGDTESAPDEGSGSSADEGGAE